jgi:hypothetical protein
VPACDESLSPKQDQMRLKGVAHDFVPAAIGIEQAERCRL